MTAVETEIVTISTAKKKSQYTEDPVVMNYNANLIMSQVLYLVGNQQTDFSTIFNYELAPVPMSMFQYLEEARYSKTKLALKNKLKIDVSV